MESEETLRGGASPGKRWGRKGNPDGVGLQGLPRRKEAESVWARNAWAGAGMGTRGESAPAKWPECAVPLCGASLVSGGGFLPDGMALSRLAGLVMPSGGQFSVCMCLVCCL